MAQAAVRSDIDSFLNYRMSVLGQRILLGCLVYLENLVKTYNIYSEEFDPGSG